MPRLLLLALLAALAASAPALAQTCTTTWTTERVTNSSGDVFFVWSDGSWQDASRWSDGVPTADDTACVLGPSEGRADFDVTSGAAVQIRGLVVGNRQTGPIRVLFNAPATGVQAGRVFGSGRIDGDLTIDGPFEVEDAWMSGQLTVGPQGTLIVAQSEANNGNGFTSQLGCASVQNNPLLGPLGLTVNGGRVEIRESVGVCGRVEWNGGTLAVQADDREGNRTLFRTYVAGGRFAPPGDFDDSGFYRNVTFDVDANTSVILGGFYRVSGTMSGTSDGDLSFSQNILTFGDGGLIVEESGVTFGVGGSQGLAIKVPQSSRRREYQITTEGGEIVNTGTLRFPTGSRRFNAVTLRNRGEIRSEGSIVYLAGGSVLDNQAGGAVRFVDGGSNPFIYGDNFNAPGGARILSAGRIVMESESNQGGINVPVEVAGGAVEVEAGENQRLTFSQGGSFNGATFAVGEGSSLFLQRTWEVAGALDGTASGDLQFVGVRNDTTRVRAVGDATLAVGGRGLDISGRSGRIVVEATDGGQFTNTGQALVNGIQIWRSVPFRNEGALAFEFASISLQDGTTITNSPDATAAFTSSRFGGSNAASDEDSQFVNEGLATFLSTGSTGTSFNGRGIGRPGSELRLATAGVSSSNSALSLAEADSLLYAVPGVTLSGRGSFSLNPNDLFLPGVLSPGSPETPFDTLATRAFVRFTPTSRFVVDLGPDATDYVDAINRFDLNGTLALRLADGYFPEAGTEWTIAELNSTASGAFAAIEGPIGYAFEVDTSRPGALVVRVAGGRAQSSLTAAAAAGASEIQVSDEGVFTAGDVVVVGAGTATAEEATVAAVTSGRGAAGSLTLASPLASAHEAGARVVVARGVPAEPAVSPTALAVTAAPNPARTQAMVSVTVPETGPARVAVYDALGRQVAVLHDGPLAAGTHGLRLDAAGLAPGLYVVRAAAGGGAASRTITVVR